MLLVASSYEQDDHDPGEGHPEQVGRLEAAIAALRAPRMEGAVEWLRPQMASRKELEAVHDPAYLNVVVDLCASGGGAVDPDTFLSPGTWRTACLTAGAGLTAAEALAAGKGAAAFVLGRPPGHHAGRSKAMGFCVLNNVGVTAARLTSRGERVAIIDWDVHHGNGTQELFWSEPSVLYVSIHQWPLYPGTGRPEERGPAEAYGTTLNLPMPAGTTGDGYRALMDDVVLGAVERFNPDWVLVSAGFDAHRADPLGDMLLTAGDYADLTGRVVAAVPQARLMFFLEGGYDLHAIRTSVASCAARLVGDPFRPEAASSGGPGMTRVDQYRARFSGEGLIR